MNVLRIYIQNNFNMNLLFEIFEDVWVQYYFMEGTIGEFFSKIYETRVFFSILDLYKLATLDNVLPGKNTTFPVMCSTSCTSVKIQHCHMYHQIRHSWQAILVWTYCMIYIFNFYTLHKALDMSLSKYRGN